jgi:DNA-binding transcriptional MerR regulator
MKSEINRLYYSITEISAMFGEEPHALRYWEREFPQLRPQKNRAGKRIYGEREIQVLRVIQYLLRSKRYTVAGALEQLRQTPVEELLKQMQEAPEPKSVDPPAEEIRDVVAELRGIARELRRQASAGASDS